VTLPHHPTFVAKGLCVREIRLLKPIKDSLVLVALLKVPKDTSSALWPTYRQTVMKHESEWGGIRGKWLFNRSCEAPKDASYVKNSQ
jgi:hypothetical protein